MGKFTLYFQVVAIAVLVSFTPGEAGRNRISNADRIKFHEHMNTVNAFVCSEPQSRAVKLAELGITNGDGEQYIPQATVLNRCDCAGHCATAGTECKAASTRTVEVIFKVVTHIGVESMRFQRYNVTDHVSCSCQ